MKAPRKKKLKDEFDTQADTELDDGRPVPFARSRNSRRAMS